MKKNLNKRGFTLIEVLVVIGIIALLAAIVIIAINPARQFAQSRDTQRVSNLNTILNAIGQRMADNKGLFRITTDPTCLAAMDLPTPMGARRISSGDLDLRPCLVPTYVSEIVVDPSIGTFVNGGNYDTGYNVSRDADGRVHLIAINPETAIPRNNPLEVVR